MADAIQDLLRLSAGIEVTKGTIVPATVQLVGQPEWIEEVETYQSEYPDGYRVPSGGAGVVKRRGVIVKVASKLTAEDIMWPLNTGIRLVTPVNSSGDYTSTFSPQLTTAIPTIGTASLEYVESDGSTNHIARKVGYAMCDQFSIEWAMNEPAALNYQFFGRASQALASPAAVVPYTSRYGQELVTPLLSVYWDTAWSGLGGTQLTVVRSGKFECMTGFAPDWKAAGRTDLDFYIHKVGKLTAKLQLVLELDAVGAAKFGQYRTNDVVFVRLSQLGNTVAAVPRKVQIDGAWRFASTPKLGPDGPTRLVTVDLTNVRETVSNKSLEFVVVNGLASL